jgi:hypothetical protein
MDGVIKMRITKRQLRRIIKEEKSRLLRESTADMELIQMLLDEHGGKIAEGWGGNMDEMFDEDPAAFAGRSTKEEWVLQVDAAVAQLEEAIKVAVEKEIERVEMELHDGQFLTTR